MKTEKKNEAIRLRKNGISLQKIANELNVSKGSVSLWVRDVVLTDEQINQLGFRNCSLIRDARSAKCKEIRLKNQDIGRQKILNNNKDFSFGCALFWGEGDKSRNVVSFCNTDLSMMKFFVGFLKKYFDLKNEDFSLRINCYLNNGLTLDEIQNYWINNLELKGSSIIKATIKSDYYQQPNNIKHIYGVCKINVCRTDVCQQLFGAIKEMINDKSDRWAN